METLLWPLSTQGSTCPVQQARDNSKPESNRKDRLHTAERRFPEEGVNGQVGLPRFHGSS